MDIIIPFTCAHCGKNYEPASGGICSQCGKTVCLHCLGLGRISRKDLEIICPDCNRKKAS